VITAYIALGSNVGDRERHLDQGLRGLRAAPGVEVVRVSSWIETAFVGDGPEQGPFLNGAAELRTTLSPTALLGVMRALEQEAGRASPHPRNHPRELDLDLIFFGDERIDQRELQVPHPRWHEREFVCAPLRELGVDVEARPRDVRPEVIHDAGALTTRVAEWAAGGCSIGLVPTMGSLHDGHASLIRAARAQCDRVLVTVFVNPLQFGADEDFEAYPRDLERDLAVCKAAGCDALFAPAGAHMISDGFASHVGTGPEATGMEGALRAGHFSGVATIVARLFAMTRPQRAYFGEKDAQQLAVVRRMRADLGFAVEVVACPIVREPDGLAMSSRNVYLCGDDRAAATVLFRALTAAEQRFRGGARDRDGLIAAARQVLDAEPRCAVDYVELRRERDLAPLPSGDVDGVRMLVAARFCGGERPVRLLDNLAWSSGGEV
ncbi:MAG: pantoate--beta-alanine ligase, partial [Planctomycetota bacterium]|nr:pantoate--beta-alanine ligase [Planctomycetota bacterium]